jgi:poly-beta-1,6-N-acetyl-D-glucosamine biosynthesis protein PgaD
MKSYIINAPHLQSLQKRVGALFAWAICWVMWIYLLIPLVTLSNWVLGDKKLINQMRWFGGYKSLLELMQIYLMSLLIMMGLWLLWIAYRLLTKPSNSSSTPKKVSDEALCAFYHVKIEDLPFCRKATMVTVFFDADGHIIKLEPHKPLA